MKLNANVPVSEVKFDDEMIRVRVPKAVKSSYVSEKEVTKAIRSMLQEKEVFHWKQHQSLGGVRGVADILGLLPGGRFFAVEVKSSRGTLGLEQALFLQGVRANGGLAFVARSVEDVEKNLWGGDETNSAD